MVIKYNPEIHKRRSIRLKEYDYSQTGAYFVTICAWQRECMFGEINDGQMRLNENSLVVEKYFNKITGHFPNIETDMYVIMPNHMHGIIIINGNGRGGVPPPVANANIFAKKGRETLPLRKPTLGQIIAYFKYQSTKQINIIHNTPGRPVWQRNYYEHIIRNEKELYKIRNYIRNNPLQWDMDENNPRNLKPL